ncbi:cation transporting ATPase C-terminal domain-containing protein [Streptomyces sp. NPDC017964]|uniref:cation transporting ATPase C-terminal domain-containing protein n=1 Tax=Streptomyces sp. NPDC017964 TaxID=3365022 RepID=UPI0037A5E620
MPSSRVGRPNGAELWSAWGGRSGQVTSGAARAAEVSSAPQRRKRGRHAPGVWADRSRPPGQQILADGAWQRLLFLAGVVAASSLGAGVVAQHSGLPWKSVLFLALLASQLGVVLGLWTRLLTRQNFFLPLSVLASVLLAWAALYVPFLQSVLETEPLGWSAVGLAAIAAVTGCAAARLSRAAFHAR